MSDPLLFVVDPEDSGERLDRFLAARVAELSRSRLASLVESGHVLVDGRPAKVSARLKPDSTVSLSLPAPVPARPQPEELGLSVLYDDADLLVVDKPAGMVVHPAAGIHSGTLVNALLFHVKDLSGIGGEVRPGIVHRLDKDTSGALVVAKNDYTLATLQKAFSERRVEKRYLALVHGVPPKEGCFDTPFGRHPVERVRMTARLEEGPGVRRAVTLWRTKAPFGEEAALVEVRLETGRTHQIRVHFSEAGYPLLGDATYGGARRDKKAAPRVREAATQLGRQALHAWRLSFEHPRTGERVAVEAPVPADFEAAWTHLRGEGL